ncbi:hypothetical protein [Paraglaciecola marina]|uniref:hypothetical protein n=1 Tax=Paraglaciecola marina TaxID=2500157 RepID=UPI003B8350FA
MDHADTQVDKHNPGVTIAPLFKDEYEEVSMLHIPPNTRFKAEVANGAELFILNGSFVKAADVLQKHN